MDRKHTAGPWTAKHVGGSNFAVQAFDIRAPFGSKPHVYPIFNRDASSVNGTVVYVSPGDAALVAAAEETSWRHASGDRPPNPQPRERRSHAERGKR